MHTLWQLHADNGKTAVRTDPIVRTL